MSTSVVKRYWHAGTATLPAGWHEYVDAPSHDIIANALLLAQGEIDLAVQQHKALAATLFDAQQAVLTEGLARMAAEARIATLEAENAGLCHDLERCMAREVALLNLTSAETPVSTLCAICDQIKELHPSTHPWTAKPSAQENASEVAK